MAPGENLLFLLAWGSFGAALIAHWADLFLARPGAAARWGRRFMVSGAVTGGLALVLRCRMTGHAPMSNLYESLSFFACASAVAHLIATRRTGLSILGAFVSPICVGLLSMASRYRPESLQPLMPALRHSWLLPLHVAIAFLGEACFAVGFAAAVIYLLKAWRDADAAGRATPWARRAHALFLFCVGFLAAFGGLWLVLRLVGAVEARLLAALGRAGLRGTQALLAFLAGVWTMGPGRRWVDGPVERVARAAPSLEELDRLSYAFIAIGYPLFALGAIVLGMAWAHRAWGRYWGWDPKETWSLVTFLVYSVYVHARYLRSWRGVPAACFAVIGFLVTLFTFLGVNLLLSGLHSYATG